MDLQSIGHGQNILRFAGDRGKNAGATLQVGAAFPWLGSAQRDCLSQYLFWCPRGWPRWPGLAVVASRLGRRLRQTPVFGDALRTVISRLDQQHCLVTGRRTTLDQPLRRASQLFDRQLLTIAPLPRQPSANWLKKTTDGPFEHEYRIYARPVTGSERARQNDRQWIDELVFALAAKLRGLYVRPRGNIFRLIQQRLQSDMHPLHTQLLMSDELDDGETKRQLLELGGSAWVLLSPPAAAASTETPTAQVHTPIRSLDEFETSEYLSHWTRGVQGNWPDESVDSQWDRFLFGSAIQEAGPLASLYRILCQQKLLATNQLIRSGDRVVCFTEVPLTEFLGRRRFQSHLSRWDFEPYGVAVRRSALQKLCGAQPAIYGDESTWSRLTEFQRPFFQKLGDSTGERSTDWTEEKEWRVVGDVDLRAFAENELLVFVFDQAAAKMVAPLSRWPLVVLASGEPASLAAPRRR